YEPTAFRVLAAHVYYRALRAIPSLIRSWWADCKDRQLSTAFASYTATYFSPILISSELSNLRDSPDGSGPTAREKLEDEALTIKISNSISEVSVIYLVDEQQMEMAIRMPLEYPLKLGDVRDVRRVGVAEDKWRGWLLAVQQIIGTQNGHIADAIALFKKNVTLHFQGQVECAICYSVTDLQLPTKPCKTCKNRFHASCLYKVCGFHYDIGWCSDFLSSGSDRLDRTSPFILRPNKDKCLFDPNHFAHHRTCLAQCW
ncbi:7999_t:CDS:2, partial [Acaulospora colombiana]